MKLKPLFDRVLLKQEEEKKDASNIILPTNLQEKPAIAQVVAVGDGNTVDGKIEMSVKIGDKVVFSRYAAQEFKFNKETYLLIRQDDILAVME